MPARVEETAELAAAVAHDNDRLTANEGGEKIIRLCRLTIEADEDPAAFEDMLHLELVDFLAPEDIGVDAKDAVLGTIIDQRVEFHRHSDFLSLATRTRNSTVIARGEATKQSRAAGLLRCARK
jgi:hypothetical protein